MTLGDFFQFCGQHPILLTAVFVAAPLLAYALGKSLGPSESASPVLYGYTGLIYFVSLPGIFAITLTAYFFFFERRSIMQTNLITQVLPVISMVLTFYFISKKVALEKVPGFGRISGLLTIVGVVMSVMWILDKTRIIAFTFIPFSYVIGLFALLFGLVYFNWQKVKTKG